MQLTLYTQPNCPLCDEAEAKLKLICEDLATTYKAVDIHSDDHLLEAYQLRIPVIMANKKILAEGQIAFVPLEEAVHQQLKNQ